MNVTKIIGFNIAMHARV